MSDSNMDGQPDKYLVSWWKQQFAEVLKGYRGATHGINRCLADYADCVRAITELRERCDSLEREREEDRAKIAELRTELEAVSEKQDKLIERLKAKFKENGHGETA